MTDPIENPDIVTIDCHYIAPYYAAAYLIVEGDQAAFIDNNTSYAMPHLMAALKEQDMHPEQVAYIIITHLHFDHAGGTSALAKLCPNAQVLCHPKAVRHLVEPERLVASVTHVYGEERFAELYGLIEPIPAKRVREVADGETILLGKRPLKMLHTPGHAKHHIVIHDEKAQSAFTGDIFGVMHRSPTAMPTPCLLFSSAPKDFDAALAKKSIRRILDTGANRLYLSHFGAYTSLGKGEAQLFECIEALDLILTDVRELGMTGDMLTTYCESRVHTAYADVLANWDVKLSDAGWTWLEEDIRISALGLALLAEEES